MNLEGFDKPESMPPNWKFYALHEFGHAIGFEHEHQGLACNFRFNDDPGYIQTTDPETHAFIEDANGKRPGLYTQLGGPPNYWSQDYVNRNLKQLPPSEAFPGGKPDKNSIMMYHFPAEMFEAGERSPCYSSVEALDLSAQDKIGAGLVYPFAKPSIEVNLAVHTKTVEEIAKNSQLPRLMQNHFQSRLLEIRRR